MTAKPLLHLSMLQAVLWAFLVCAALAPLSARAEGSASYDTSVQQAVLEYNAGHFEEAHALFRQAHEQTPNARTWRGLGICAFELRHYVEATRDLETALVDTRKPLTPAQREETSALLERARAFVSEYRVHLKPKNAQLSVDGKRAELVDHVLQLDPGTHTLVARAPGHLDSRTELRAGAGAGEELEIELAVVDSDQPKDAPPSARPPADEQSAPASSKRRRIWTWTLTASAVAAAAVAVGLRLHVNNLHDEFDKCAEVNIGNDECDNVKESGEKATTGARVAGGVAGALAVGGVLAIILESRRKPSDRGLSWSIGPQSVMLRGRF